MNKHSDRAYFSYSCLRIIWIKYSMLYQMIIFPGAINQVLAVIVKKGIDVQVSVNV